MSVDPSAAFRRDLARWVIHRVTSGEGFGDGTGSRHEYPDLGARVVFGAGAVILSGVRVGNDAVVRANAVVVGDVDAADVVVGVLARSTRPAGDLGTPHADRTAPR